jgi:transposase
MSIHTQTINPVPEETARVAHHAFPKGNRYLTLRDELGTIYTDQDFADLFSAYGQSAVPPWHLALICVMQFMEDLTDRQAAEAVRSRIDWKYALSLELGDPGFDFSVLSEFRTRLIAGNAEQKLLDQLLAACKERGWVKARGKQRTDSTHILAAIRTLNRLEVIGETLRAALNALATIAPDWLQAWVPPVWFERYGRAVDEYRLPKGVDARKVYAETIGMDGMQLLATLWSDTTPIALRQISVVETLRQTWVHQFSMSEGQVHLRAAKDLPPAGERMDSPYDPDARYGNKRSTTWTGYKVHLTETCDENQVHLITHVITTHAHQADVAQTEPIHAALEAKALLPEQHMVDAGFVDANLIVTSQKQYGVELIGPVRPNVSWQAKTPGAYDINQFQVHWQTKRVTCPQGKKSQQWNPAVDAWGNHVINVRFSRSQCRQCSSRPLCTRAKTDPREITLRPQAEYQALQVVRQQQTTKAWQQTYNQRAGIEGTLSQGLNAFGLRRARYLGLAKTRLQHILTSTAMNIVRLTAWLQGLPHARTRTSRFARLAPVPDYV